MRRPALPLLLLLVCSVCTEDEIPDANDDAMLQREIAHPLQGQQRPNYEIPDADAMLQREIVRPLQVQQRPMQVPFLIQEPVLIPRGRRPNFPCGERKSCSLDGLTDSIGSNLNTFPPGRPSSDNIASICRKNRPRTTYGSHNLPQTGFAHLSRQGDAINELENGFTACCQKPEKLQCAVETWKKTLEDFCDAEFSVKTNQFHCCKKSGSEREDCFSNGASNPSYVTSAGLQLSSDDAGAEASPRGRKICPKCPENPDSKYKLSDLSFPPGEPKSSNIQNICKLRKYRPLFTDNQLPDTGFGHYMRRAKAIQRMEGEFKKCCKTEDVACAHAGWKKVLGKFCAKEQIVKTKHHECCKKRDETSMLSCFASEAPFPEYDREVEVLNLGNITAEVLQKVCGECKLLTKQKQIPLLVSGLRDLCCPLPQEKKLQCAAEQREKFIKTLCGVKKESWKDTQDCCSKGEQEREQCFSHYLENISMAISQRTKEE